MIPLELLRQSGNVEVLLTLVDSPKQTVGELADVTELHSSTVRQRMNGLQDAGLVQAEAAMVDGRPTRVWSITDTGAGVAETIQTVVLDYEAGDTSPAAQSTDGTDTGTADD